MPFSKIKQLFVVGTGFLQLHLPGVVQAWRLGNLYALERERERVRAGSERADA